MLGRGVAAELSDPYNTPESFWGTTLPVLQGADLVVANLASPITEWPHPRNPHSRAGHFKAPPRAIDLLRAGGVRLVSLASGHVLDFDHQGLVDTMATLDQAGIAHAGAGLTL